ncbi:MAG: TetR/AcrR family transcriptional regulator [Gammaproteobacteria bacterium]
MRRKATRPGRPSGRDDRDVRAELLQAARDLFTAHGFDGVSTRRLAREADTTAAMIHYYFGDKHGLFRASLESLATIYISMFQENPWMPRLMFREVLEGDAKLRDQFAARVAGRLIPVIEDALREERAAGRVRTDIEPVSVVVTVMSLCVYPFLAKPLIEAGFGKKFDADFVAYWRDHVVRMLYKGLQP